MNLSIIIVSFNTKEVTRDCLNSIYNAIWRRPYEVIVVDNDSKDGSQKMIKECFPKVKLIENNHNALFAIANNQGAEIAKGKYILLLNSDTLVDSDNLERMTEFFDTLPENYICIGPKILRPDGTLQACGHPAMGTYREIFMIRSKIYKILPYRLNNFILKGLPSEKQRLVGWVTGCAMMMRSDLYRTVGGLNENIEFYGEEPEFGYRTYKLGYKTLFWPKAQIVHLGGVSTKVSEMINGKEDQEVPLRRYKALVKETIGIGKACRLAKLEIFLAKVKLKSGQGKKDNLMTIEAQQNIIKYLEKG